MDKFRGTAEKRLKGQHPDMLAKEALVRAEFASRQRNEFFDQAYGDILVEYFINWLQTEPHETKSREFIYSCALGLGDIKARLIQYETYGKNIPHMEEDNGTPSE